MKILHVNFSDYLGGAAIAVNRINNSLINSGIDSKMVVSESLSGNENILSIKKTSESIKNLIKKSLSRKLKIFFSTDNKNTHSLNIVPSKLLNVINDYNADVVNLHWIGNETLSISDINKIKSKIVWTLHDMWPFAGAEHYTNDKRFIDGYTKLNRPKSEKGFDLNKFIWNKKIKNYSNISKIIVTSDWMKNNAQKSYLFKKKLIKEIPLPIDQNFWKVENQKFSKEQLGFKDFEKMIVFGADNFSNNERKGFDFFLEILKNDHFKDHNVILFGDNNHLKISKKLKNIKKNNRIKNLGLINDKYSLKMIYSAADLIVIPSFTEAFGLIAQEAIHCGTPCVVFKNTGLESVIDHKKSGYTCEYNSIKDFTKGIDWCLTNLTNKDAISQIANYKFKTLKIIEQYLDFIK